MHRFRGRTPRYPLRVGASEEDRRAACALAVLAMTRELAIVHAREGFRFNALCPAPLKYVPTPPQLPNPEPHHFSHNYQARTLLNFPSTPLLQNWLGDDAAKRYRREVHFPTGRFGEAIEQAQAVLFLASDESSFVNGTDFVVDGGMTKVFSFFRLCLFSAVLTLAPTRPT